MRTINMTIFLLPRQAAIVARIMTRRAPHSSSATEEDDSTSPNTSAKAGYELTAADIVDEATRRILHSRIPTKQEEGEDKGDRYYAREGSVEWRIAFEGCRGGLMDVYTALHEADWVFIDIAG